MITVFVAILLVVFPTLLHGAALLGRWILDPIRSPSRSFNEFYNSHPLVLSGVAGLFAAAAFLLGKTSPAFYFCAAIGGLLFLLDMYACLLSFISYIANAKR